MNEIEVLTRMQAMCDESLCPETHDKWEQVRDELKEIREGLTKMICLGCGGKTALWYSGTMYCCPECDWMGEKIV